MNTRLHEKLAACHPKLQRGRVWWMNDGLYEPVTCSSCGAVSVNGGTMHCHRCYGRLSAEHDAEIDEFNLGYEAAECCAAVTAEPAGLKHDVWRCGWYWFMGPKLAAENERLRAENAALNLALFHVENGLAHPDERVRKLIEAALAAKGATDAAH